MSSRTMISGSQLAMISTLMPGHIGCERLNSIISTWRTSLCRILSYFLAFIKDAL